MMKNMTSTGKIPPSANVDYVPGVSHDPYGMIISDAGLEKVCS